jgi:hypothetical protein
VDLVTPRTARDALGIDGHPNKSTLAAATKLIYVFQRDGQWNNQNLSSVFNGYRPETAREVVAKHPELPESVAYIEQHRSVRGIAKSIISALHYITANYIDEDKADSFARGVMTGEQLERGDPIMVLRDKLTGTFIQSQRLTRTEQMHIIIKAWNMHYENRTGLKVLKLSANFPVLKGMDGRLEEKLL